MKAALCKSYGPPENLSIQEVDDPVVNDDGVLIDVHAIGVNFPDTLIIENKYQFKPPLPFIPGTEVSGTVLAVGKRVKDFNLGDEVMAFNSWGAYAEKMLAPQATTYHKPTRLSHEEAAGYTMIYGTSYYALKQRGQLKPGETLLILGASGGVGLAAVELGKLMGAKVIAAGGSDEKLEVAKSKGADYLINYSRENLKDRVKELTAGQGADVIYDAVGGDLFDQAIRCINWNGRLLVVGFASGRIPELPVNLALLKNCQIVGVFWGASLMREPHINAENFQQLAQWAEAGKIVPHVCEVYSLEETANALNRILNRTAIGKVIISPKK